MKIIAMYLPQYHRVRQNDLWWGEGFTDWVAVKNAKPLFEGHQQPKVPLKKNYYDLLDKSTFAIQADWMQKYGIDGMCFYHYWFKNGAQILERPAENLLKWKEIRMPFCFCWANESWARSWGNIKNANPWSDTNESTDEEESPYLLKQGYGGTKDWKEHFDYLCDFFQDERYIKLDNKPVLMIYKVKLIECLYEMLKYWNFLAKENGFDGVYIIGANADNNTRKLIDAEYCAEPSNNLRFCNKINQYRDGLKVYDYDELWSGILAGKTVRHKKTYYGGLVNYDDTPRRGGNGSIVVNASPEKFQFYLEKLLAINAAFHNEFTFINAWNEWGEGMYLEPDENYGFAYLNAVKEARNNAGKEIVAKREKMVGDKRADYWEILNEKNESNMDMFDLWMSLYEKNLSIESWFERKGYKTIAIYGMGLLAKHFIESINASSVKIECLVDKNVNINHKDFKVCHSLNDIPAVDVVVICLPYCDNEVKMQIEEMGYQYVSIRHILYSMNDQIV